MSVTDDDWTGQPLDELGLDPGTLHQKLVLGAQLPEAAAQLAELANQSPGRRGTES